MPWLEYALTGLAGGFLAGYLGIGGGLILVPALSWLFSRDPAIAGVAVQMAVATSLASMLFSSMSSVLTHHRRGAILWPLVKRLLPGLLLGAVFGSLIAGRIGSAALGGVFGVFALIVGLQLLLGATQTGNRPLPGFTLIAFIGFGIGSIFSCSLRAWTFFFCVAASGGYPRSASGVASNLYSCLSIGGGSFVGPLVCGGG